jgi:hypothetical protein
MNKSWGEERSQLGELEAQWSLMKNIVEDDHEIKG